MRKVKKTLRVVACVAAPQHEHYLAWLRIHRADHRVGEGFPAFVLVRVRLMRAHGQHGVQQQHALFGPGREVAVVGDAEADIAFQLLEPKDRACKTPSGCKILFMRSQTAPSLLTASTVT